MSYFITAQNGVNLQATIASCTAIGGEEVVLPHHPITCTGGLYFDEDGDLSCDHAKAPHNNKRTQACVNHSVAVLLIELGSQL